MTEARDNEISQRVETLLAQGKNVYQPLYNYPHGQSIAPLRPCEDRCRAVALDMGDAIAGRRLWDVGCSLGFNTLYFVDRGMIGHGTDIDPRNVNLCREIQGYTNGQASFDQAELTIEAVQAIALGQYDYAFFFSMLHHVIEAKGLPYVQQMMQALIARVPVVYVELALRSETPPPGYDWARHLPDDELAIFASCGEPDIRLIGHFATHVGPLQRPLYRVAARRGS